MDSQRTAPAGPHLVQFKRGLTGKASTKIPRRLKAKHLAHSTRELIVRLFVSLESYDDVAREMGMPGLTGKTVSEVIHAWQMRRPPAAERRASVGAPAARTFRSADAA